MKKRIQITVEPLDNGYQIAGQVSGANPNEGFQARLVATSDDEVKTLTKKMIDDAFKVEPETSGIRIEGNVVR